MRFFAPLLVLPLLAACAQNLNRLNEINPAADNFEAALASEYQAYASSEAEQGRTWDANYFAGKGLDALNAKAVEPEEVESDLPPAVREEMSAMREQLLALSVDDVKRVAPQKLARAQLLFDCWEHQLSKKLSDEAPCAEEFRSTLSQLQETADPLLYGKEVGRTLTFPYKSTRLNDEAKVMIKDIADMAALMKQYNVQLRTYVGIKSSQRKLTEKRLANVRSALISAGISKDSIRIARDGGAKAVILSKDKITRNTKQIVVTIKAASDPIPVEKE